jgi:hypothetical protein
MLDVAVMLLDIPDPHGGERRNALFHLGQPSWALVACRIDDGHQQVGMSSCIKLEPRGRS